MGESLCDQDPDDSAIVRNLQLSFQERWDNAVRAARFIQRGRASLSKERREGPPRPTNDTD
jgi:hypothetical protein